MDAPLLRPPSPGAPHMSREEFADLRDLIAERTGIHIRDSRMDYLEYRVLDRMQATHTPSFRDYHYILKYNRDADGEMQALINVITVQETHFNRNPAQIKTFREKILPALLERRAKERVREFNAWSAACATGEEPYTLAICLAQTARAVAEFQPRVWASDISTRALHLAERAVYPEAKLRDYDAATISQYFQRSGERYAVSDRVRKLVEFQRVNLVMPQEWGRLPLFDVVFCRNVFIYFDTAAKQRVSDQIFRKLKPGGVLFLGNAETVDVSGVPFKMKFMEGGMVYEKP